MLAEDIGDESFALVGQSVLPLCYVIVKKGNPIIKEDDVLDIRPLLRTAELTYNERAGVAAAIPPLSLANPATGKEELYEAVQVLRDYSDDKLAGAMDVLGQRLDSEKVIPKPMQVFVTGSHSNLHDKRNIPFYDQQTVNNYQFAQDSAVGADPTVFTKYTGSTEEIQFINGIYLIEIDIALRGQSNAQYSWTGSIRDGVGNTALQLYPSVPDVNFFSTTLANDTADFEREWGFHAKFLSTFASADNVNKIALWGLIGNYSYKANGSTKITRIANVDGSEGSINSPLDS